MPADSEPPISSEVPATTTVAVAAELSAPGSDSGTITAEVTRCPVSIARACQPAQERKNESSAPSAFSVSIADTPAKATPSRLYCSACIRCTSPPRRRSATRRASTSSTATTTGTAASRGSSQTSALRCTAAEATEAAAPAERCDSSMARPSFIWTRVTRPPSWRRWKNDPGSLSIRHRNPAEERAAIASSTRLTRLCWSQVPSSTVAATTAAVRVSGSAQAVDPPSTTEAR